MRRRLGILGIAVVIVAGSGVPVAPRGQPIQPIHDPGDPRLAGLARARVRWDRPQMPQRLVADTVFLVPDEATFLQTLTAWGPRRFFPVLIEEAESTLRFVRAFRPATIVRVPPAATANTPAARWRAALDAVAASCLERGGVSEHSDAILPADNTTSSPGLVLTTPQSPALAGAVALAAGRFQALARCPPNLDPQDPLSEADALKLAQSVTRVVRFLFPAFDSLGDDLDYLTLALPWPDRYVIGGSAPYALDDLIGRIGPTGRRYAFVGRLTNAPAQSVYQAMCSLFLQPDHTLLFNSYSVRGRPWSDFEMTSAANTLSPWGSVRLCEGTGNATRRAWHEALDPVSIYGMVWVNSSGSPTTFRVQEDSASTRDIPWSRPAAVLYVHSFSAARPDDPGTIAGRWLANGAFLYFGALEEPYVQAFRTPGLLSQLLAQGVPIAAAAHKLVGEDGFGGPWRLHLLGDPLYRLEPVEIRERPRSVEPVRSDAEPIRVESELGPEAGPVERIRACWDAALLEAATGAEPGDELARKLAAIPRESLPGQEQALYQALLAELVVRSDPSAWKTLLDKVPESERQSTLRRAWEARRTGDAARGHPWP
jgi:hypothetical protein